MDSAENFNAIVMPSRTIMLTGVPPELNNSETLHTYFSKFGALLWVNEKYEQDSEAAVITFFSIAEAIAAFMSNEAILEVDSIQKSWFEYTQKCDLCPYKYSSQESIRKHIAQCHTSKECSDDSVSDIKEVYHESANGIKIHSYTISFHFISNRLIFISYYRNTSATNCQGL